jgi:hypothetical protein
MSDALALMTRDDADEYLVDFLKLLHKAAVKETATKVDEYILQLAIDNRDARLFLLDVLGFAQPDEALQFVAAMPLFENVATVLEIVEFLKKYGPQIRAAIEAIVAIINAFKGIAPSVPPASSDVPSGDRPKF